MLNNKYTKLIITIIFTVSVVLNLFSINVYAQGNDWWDESWEYRKEIYIPFDTSIKQAQFQPIDINIKFENPCFAKDETEHSIRVIYQNKGIFKELESQIYDLEKTDNNEIKSCNLVFLIPKEADGSERYHLYYSKNTKETANYYKHVSVESSYYYYEPIPGFYFKSNFYKITDDGFIIYDISQSGEGYGTSTTQYVGKLKPNSKEVLPQNGEISASFDFYFYKESAKDVEDYSSTSKKLISSEIIVDGNLMVEVGIVSQTSDGSVQTTARYKYYHCPSEDKRMHINVKHEVTEEIKLHKIAERNGVFTRLSAGEVRCGTIKDLNFGKIYPYFHFYDKDDNLCEYPLNTKEAKTSWIVYEKDDVNLGEKSWICFNEGKTGESHGLIYDSTEVIKSGNNQRNGVQIRSFQSSYPDLPGLYTNWAEIALGRNSYTENGIRNNLIPKGYVVEFNAEFFSSVKGGYQVFEAESEIFKELTRIKPDNKKELSKNSLDKSDNSLTVYVHNDKSFSLGSIVSALTGLKMPYINIELYKDTSFLSSGVTNNIPIKKIENDERITSFSKVGSAFFRLDWKDFSLFKKARFFNLEEGTYLVKIFKENTIFGSERKFIGFKILNVNGEVETNILCRPESSSIISIVDQKGNPLRDIVCNLNYDTYVISTGSSDEKGLLELKAPLLLNKPYVLNVLYQGRVIFEEEIDFRLRNIFSSVKKEILIENYELSLNVFDSWGQKPCFNFNIELRHNSDSETYVFKPDNSHDDLLIFNSLTPGSYKLFLNYQRFTYEKDIDIASSNERIDLVFPVEYKFDFKAYDSRGERLNNFIVELSRNGKRLNLNSDESDKIKIPPGSYDLKILSDNKIIAQRNLNVINDNSIDIVTSKEPVYPMILTIILIALMILFGFIYFRKKNYMSFMKILVVGFGVISLVSPWWMMNGFSDNPGVQTSWKMLVNPARMVSYTQGSNVGAGELYMLPDVFVLVLQLVFISVAIGCILILLNLFLEKFKRKKLEKYSILAALACFIFSIIVFVYSSSQLANISVGGFIGAGELNFVIPGSAVYPTFSSSWGPDIGFYLLILGLIVLFCFMIIQKRKEGRKIKNFRKKMMKILPFVGIGILLYLIYTIGIDNIASTFMKISPFHIIAVVLLIIPSALFSNIRWQIILKKQNIQIGFFETLKISFVSSFYGAVTPGKIGGYINLLYLKEKTNEPYGKLFTNNIISSILGYFSFFCFLFISALVLIDKVFVLFPIICIVFVIFLIITFYFYNKERGEKTFYRLIMLFIPKKVRNKFIKFASTFYNDFPNVKELALPFLMDIPLLILAYSQLYIIAFSLGIQIPYLEFILICPVITAVTKLPISPGAFGTRELTVMYLFSLYGVDPAASVVLSLAGYLALNLPVICLGAILSVIWNINAKKNLKSKISSVRKELSLDFR